MGVGGCPPKTLTPLSLIEPAGVPVGREALRRRGRLGVAQEDAGHGLLVLRQPDDWSERILVDPGARARVARQPARGGRQEEILDGAPAGRVVFLRRDRV